jgi:hypothetical protein
LFGTLCNSSQKTFIGFSIVESESKLSKTFDGSSKAMEAETCRELFDIIKSPKTMRLVTDGDVVLRKILRTSGSNVKHLLDIGHAFKSFVRKFNTVNVREKKISEPLVQSLVRNFGWVSKQPISAIDKKAHWANVVSHFQDDHFHCVHLPSKHPAMIDVNI